MARNAEMYCSNMGNLYDADENDVSRKEREDIWHGYSSDDDSDDETENDENDEKYVCKDLTHQNLFKICKKNKYHTFV